MIIFGRKPKKCQFFDFLNLLFLQPRKAFYRSRISQTTFSWPIVFKEKVVYDILERENPFRGYKNNKFKKSKNGHFSNIFFLGNIGQENVFYDILDRKTLFQAIKTRSSKCGKINIFPKGLTHGFGQKMAIFATFFQSI